MVRVEFFRDVRVAISLEVFVNGLFVFVCGAAVWTAASFVVAGDVVVV